MPIPVATAMITLPAITGNDFVSSKIPANNTCDIQDFMLEIKKKRTMATYKNYLSMLKIFFRDYLGKVDMIKDCRINRYLANEHFHINRLSITVNDIIGIDENVL